MIANIVILPGDGIGPEVTLAAQTVLQAAADSFGHEFHFTHAHIGGAAIDRCGNPLPQKTLRACQAAHAVLLGAVGGPRWQGLARGPESGLLELRQRMGVFANLRPVKVTEEFAEFSPLRPELVRGIDLLIVRELTGGIYFGQPRGRTADRAFDTMVYTRAEVERVARVAFQQASARRGRLTSVDKANVLECSRLWREVVTEVAREFPRVELEHMLVDSTAMALIQRPRDFDVILTSNLFGDILSDEAAVLAGGLGVLPSAAIGAGGPGLFEPVHGSAPDIAGKGIANPIGAILSAAILCDLGLGLKQEAKAIVKAVQSTLSAGFHTPDLGRTAAVSTQQFTDAVLQEFAGQ